MPERQYRLAELHQHRVQSATGVDPQLQRLLRQHPDWSICPCGWPVDPAVGTTHHPNCEREEPRA